MNQKRFYLKHRRTGLYLKCTLGGSPYYSAQTGGDGYNGAAEGFDTREEAELIAVDRDWLEIVEV